jgi:hypothetical protein
MRRIGFAVLGLVLSGAPLAAQEGLPAPGGARTRGRTQWAEIQRTAAPPPQPAPETGPPLKPAEPEPPFAAPVVPLLGGAGHPVVSVTPMPTLPPGSVLILPMYHPAAGVPFPRVDLTPPPPNHPYHFGLDGGPPPNGHARPGQFNVPPQPQSIPNPANQGRWNRPQLLPNDVKPGKPNELPPPSEEKSEKGRLDGPRNEGPKFGTGVTPAANEGQNLTPASGYSIGTPYAAPYAVQAGQGGRGPVEIIVTHAPPAGVMLLVPVAGRVGPP